MKPLQNLLLMLSPLLFIIIVPAAKAEATDTVNATKFIARLDAFLDEPLPELSQVLPLYSRPKNKNTSLIVGVFTNESDDNINWGLLLSEIFRINLNSLPSRPVDVGSLQLSNLKYDARSIYYQAGEFVDLTNNQNLVTLGQRYGINKTLSGTVKNNKGIFDVSITITNLKTDVKTSTTFSFEQQKLKPQLGLILEWIYRQLGNNDPIDLDKIRNIGPDNIELLSEFSPLLEKIYLDQSVDFHEDLAEKFEQEFNFPTAQFYQILKYEKGNSINEHNAKIAKIASKYPNFQAIQSAAAISFWHLGQAGLLQTKIIEIQNVIASSSVEYSGFLKIIRNLVDYGKPFDAVAVAKEEVLRWPYRHRSWWQLSYAIKQLAWHYRGDEFWRDVPQEDKFKYRKLLEYSKEAIDVALKLHPSSGEAYASRIALHGGYKADLYEDFIKSIQYDPEKKYIYGRALHFSDPKWGGNVITQNKIYQAAVEHNLPEIELEELWYEFIEPNKNKPENLFYAFATKLGIPDNYFQGVFFEESYQNNKKIIFGCGAIGICFLSIFFVRREKQRKLHREIALTKSAELWEKVTVLKQRLDLERKNLIIERQEYGFVLPQINQYYFVFFDSEDLKIDSHFGVINGSIEEASSTMLEVVEAGAKQLFH